MSKREKRAHEQAMDVGSKSRLGWLSSRGVLVRMLALLVLMLAGEPVGVVSPIRYYVRPPGLIEIVADEDLSIQARLEAAQALSSKARPELGSELVELERTLRSQWEEEPSRYEIRLSELVAESLLLVDEPAGQEAFRRLLPFHPHTLHIARRLARLGDPSGFEYLETDLSSWDWTVRREALGSLPSFLVFDGTGVDVAGALIWGLQDPVEVNRDLARRVLVEGAAAGLMQARLTEILGAVGEKRREIEEEIKKHKRLEILRGYLQERRLERSAEQATEGWQP